MHGMLIGNGILYRDRLLPSAFCRTIPTPSAFTPATQAIYVSVFI